MKRKVIKKVEETFENFQKRMELTRVDIEPY